jgi:putative DNA primase/helicase
MLLIGARFVRASEPREGEPLQEELIKELTGGEPIMVRALNSDFVEMNPYFKLTISGNHKPVVRGTDDGIWRRLLLVPWDVQIPEGRRDKDLGEYLFRNERSGILNRLRDGLLDYLEGGLAVPGLVSDATKEFREESDPVGTFLEQCCVITGDHRDSIGARELGEAFNFWLSDAGMGEFKPRTVAIKLKEKAGRWKSKITGKSFVARKSSTMAYDGIQFNAVFGQRWRDLPRDAQGRVLRGRMEGGE